MTEQEMIAIMKSKGITDQQIEEGRRMRMSGGGIKQPPPTIGQRVGGGLQGGIRGLLAGMGVQPNAVLGDDNQNYYAKAVAEQQAKTMFEDPLDKKLKEARINQANAGYTFDEAGNPIKAVNPQTEEREKRLREFEKRKQGVTLRGELNQNDYVKRYQAMSPQTQGIDAMLQDTLSRPDLKSKNIGDQALITLYNKILDPMSVVRESEYARTPEGLSLMNRIQGFVENVSKGGANITDADRIEIARAAKILMNESGKVYNQKLDDYSHLADTYEVDPELVTGGYQRFTPYDINKQYQIGGATTPQPIQATPQQPQGNIPPEIQALLAKGHKLIGVRNG